MALTLSILVPSIRTHFWERYYKSLRRSAKKTSFEIVFVSPFTRPTEFNKHYDIKHFQDFGSPTRCAQLGSFDCEGDLLLYHVDDAIFYEDAIDRCVEYFEKNCKPIDIVNCRYREGVNFEGQELPLEYWDAKHHDELKPLQGIPDSFKISLHPMMRLSYFRELGGFDAAAYIYMHATLDLMFRAQADGAVVHNSPVEVSNCSHLPGMTLDHGPIHLAQTMHDLPVFRSVYGQEHDIAARAKIDINNWTNTPSIWKDRFANTLPKNYNSLLLK